MPQPSPGTLYLVPGQPNPNGAEGTQLYLLSGDPALAPIREIIPTESVVLPTAPTNLAERPFRLCLLHCNDIHGHVSHISARGDRPIFSRMVWRLRERRKKCRADPYTVVLFLSAGDDLVGSVLGELLGDDPESYVVHVGYKLFSAAGLDVGVLGNHDLDLGLDLLARALQRDAQYPMLSANLAGCRQLEGIIYPAALLVVKGLRIGIAGLTTRGEVKRANDPSLCLANPLHVAQNLIPALRPLCDVLIVLSHLGNSLSCTTATVLDAGDVELAASLPPGSVDLIVGGHSHQSLNEGGLAVTNIVNGVPIVQAGASGRFLGEVDITVSQPVTVTDVRLSLVADLPIDQDFETQSVQPILDRIRPLLARSLGRVVDHPDLSTRAVRAAFAIGESAFSNFVTDALVAGCRAAGHNVDLAAIDASSLYRGLQPGGDLTFGDWFDVMPYADTIQLCAITSCELQSLLDDNARRADEPGEPHTERGFLQFSQELRYTIELGEDRSQARAHQVTVDGIPLEEQLDRTLLLACTSFCREAARPWEQHAAENLGIPCSSLPPAPHVETDLSVRDELIAYILEHGGVLKDAGARRDGRLIITANDSAVAGLQTEPTIKDRKSEIAD